MEIAAVLCSLVFDLDSNPTAAAAGMPDEALLADKFREVKEEKEFQDFKNSPFALVQKSLDSLGSHGCDPREC